MSQPIQVTEKDLYAMIGEQAMIIRVQEQMIARLQEKLDRNAASSGAPATVSTAARPSRPSPSATPSRR